LALTTLLYICCSPAPHLSKQTNPLAFLAGTWKAEGKELYETWALTDAATLNGEGYRIKGGQKVVTEQLRIKTIDGKTAYTATVVAQNNGQPVDFILNPEVKDRYSFENLGHDFPQKIQYLPQGKDTLLVSVLGEGGKGFMLKMMRQ
jgi:hypothetical protein